MTDRSVENILSWNKGIVSITPSRFMTLVNVLPLELLMAQPAPDEWSALECLHHLVVLERAATSGRISAFLNNGTFPSVDFAAAKAETPTTILAAEFEQCRAVSLLHLDQVTEADFDRELVHPTLGPITLRMYLHHWAAHDLMHTVQAQQALMQPFIASCGPWIENYTDHLAARGRNEVSPSVPDDPNKLLEWCWAALSATSVCFLNMINIIPLELLTARPAPGQWSMLDCLRHLVDVERISTHVRIRALTVGEPMVGFNPAEASEQTSDVTTAVALAEEFVHLRQQTLKVLEQLTPSDLDLQAMHAEYGMVTMREFLSHLAAHDLMHTVQAQRAVMQPLIAGVGPWRVNYAAHIAHA